VYISTTDGKEFLIPDMCPYCQLDTAGNHDLKCPSFGTDKIITIFNEVLARDWLHPDEDKAWEDLCMTIR